MEIQISGKQTKVNDRFKELVEKKLEKVSYYMPHATLIHVEVKEQNNPSRQGEAEKVEITITGQGSIHRSVARGIDRYAAFDEAIYKLFEQLRRSHDKLLTLRSKTSLKHLEVLPIAEQDLKDAKENVSDDVIEQMAEKYNRYSETQINDDLVVRSKVHKTRPMSVEDAIYHMEMLNHPFFIFINKETGRSSLIYTRKHWNYGMLELDLVDDDQEVKA